MSSPVPYAVGATWQTNGSADFLHLKNLGGTVVGWIDANGVPQGTLASGGSGTPGGSSGNLQFNNSGVLGGVLRSSVSGSTVTFKDASNNSVSILGTRINIIDSSGNLQAITATEIDLVSNSDSSTIVLGFQVRNAENALVIQAGNGTSESSLSPTKLILGSAMSGNLTFQATNAVAGDHTILVPSIGGTLAIETGAPTTATSTGVTGSIAYDSTHMYVCVATNTWVRAVLSTF